MKENNNVIKVYAGAVTVLAIGLLVYCIALMAIKCDLEKQVLILRSQVKRLQASPTITIPMKSQAGRRQKEEANDTKRNSE